MNNNKKWILLVPVAVTGAVLFILLLGSGQESLEQKYGLYLPDPHQTSTTGSLPAGKLDLLTDDPTELMGRLTNSISALESGVMSDQGKTDTSIETEQQPAVLPPPKLPTSTESVQAIERLAPPAAGQPGGETGAVITPQQIGVPIALRGSTGIVPVDTPPLSPLSKPETALPGAPASATPSTDSVASGQSGAIKSLQAPGNKVAILDNQDPVNGKPPAPSAAKQGPWVINIASSQDKADAERLAEKARSRDFQTDLQHVTVKGRQYWRVQITGFSTKEEAMAKADTAKDVLGLKDVWITTR